MQLELKDIKQPRRTERDAKQLESLVESIKEVGMIEPIVLNERKEIISGRRRFFAAKELELKKIPVVFFDKKAVDQQLAEIDANLMILPLGALEHDLALSKRKKLYEEKYPETRQHVSKGEHPSFTADTSSRLGVSKRTIEQAVARVENASPALNNARKENKISTSVAGQLARLPKSYQDKLIPKVAGKKVAEVKKIVDTALDKNLDKALILTKKIEQQVSPDDISKAQKQLLELIDKAIDRKLDKAEVAPILKETKELATKLLSFIEYYSAPKTILRKSRVQEQFV